MADQREVVDHYRRNLQLAQELTDRWSLLSARLDESLRSVESQSAVARLALAAAYLLEVDRESLRRAERLTGYRGFTRRDPIAAREHERRVLDKTIRRIEADERYQRREFIVGPHGELTRALEEARELLQPWEDACLEFEMHDGFLELVEVQYDTPEFGESWYQAKYWRHWAAGDRICAALGMDDFGDDVLPAYHKVLEPRTKWRGEVARISAKVDEIHELVRVRDQAELRIPRLPALYLASCQEQLAEFFVHADLGLLEEWLEGSGGDRGVQQVLRRCAGLQAKRAFLKEMKDKGIDMQLAELQNRQAKFRRKITKYSRSKYGYQHFGPEVFDLKFQQKEDKYLAQPDKLGRQLDKVLEFDDYGSFDLANEPELWWVRMTKRSPSRFTPRLRKWYERHPEAAPVLERDDSADVVMSAAATVDRTDRGYLS